jgi:hypothetical protein
LREPCWRCCWTIACSPSSAEVVRPLRHWLLPFARCIRLSSVGDGI